MMDAEEHLRAQMALIEATLKQERTDFKRRYDDAVKSGMSSNTLALKCAEQCISHLENMFRDFLIEYDKLFPEVK